ncbi:hypothetical protein GQ457_15G006280 [Hibiscus cannabinus]
MAYDSRWIRIKEPIEVVEEDPFGLQSEAEKVLLDMEFYGVPRNVETFNVLLGNLCKKSAGFGDQLGKKEYYGFLKILCGIERVEHAMTIFKKMKAEAGGCKPGIKSTYDLLMEKWCAHNRLDISSHMKKTRAVKKEKKR